MITKFKIFENKDEDWIINIDKIIDKNIVSQLDDISDFVKKGDIVIGVWFDGDFEYYLLKVEEIDDGELGACSDDACHLISYSWGIFSLEDYKKYDPNFELKISANKYNL